jgi:hypothetical protein
MKIADQRHRHAHAVELLTNRRHGRRRFRRVDRDTHQFRTGLRQFLDLDRRADRVRGVGVGHRLDAHGRIATDRDELSAPTNIDRVRLAPRGVPAEHRLV